jgi:hypothetical protein
MRNTGRMNRLEELGRVDSERARTTKGRRNLAGEKDRLVAELSATKMKKGGEAKPGLYANIQAKRKRIAAGSGEKMRKVGSKGAPTAKAFIESAKTAKKGK